MFSSFRFRSVKGQKFRAGETLVVRFLNLDYNQD